MGIFSVSSSAFSENGQIPLKYTCDGENISPPLKIEHVPVGTKSFVLIVEDPDAITGVFAHWIVWNISPGKTEIYEGEELGRNHGKNGFGKYNYGGPCPPNGTHRYFFRVFAMDCEIDIPETSSRKALEVEMQGHVIDEASLIGLYSRLNK